MLFAPRDSIQSRYVDIFQYPEISGNGRGSGHACLDGPRGYRKWHVPPRNRDLSSKELNSLEAAFFVERKKKYRRSYFNV